MPMAYNAMENLLRLSRLVLANLEQADLNHQSGNHVLLLKDLHMAALLAESLVRQIAAAEMQIEKSPRILQGHLTFAQR